MNHSQFVLQQFPGCAYSMILKINPYLFHRETQFSKFTDHIQPPDIFCTVETVLVLPPLRPQNSDLLVIP